MPIEIYKTINKQYKNACTNIATVKQYDNENITLIYENNKPYIILEEYGLNKIPVTIQNATKLQQQLRTRCELKLFYGTHESIEWEVREQINSEREPTVHFYLKPSQHLNERPEWVGELLDRIETTESKFYWGQPIKQFFTVAPYNTHDIEQQYIEEYMQSFGYNENFAEKNFRKSYHNTENHFPAPQ